MAHGGRKIYKKRSPVKIAFAGLLIAVLLFIFITVAVFFGFRRYIVYTPDGLYLDVPWLQSDRAADPADPAADPVDAADEDTGL